MTRLASPDHPAFVDDLRRLAAAVDTVRGRLTVVLPDREVWRDRLRLGARTPWMRRRKARILAARALAVAPGEVALSVGRQGDDGATALAATRRQTLLEVRRMLAAVGLRAEVIRGAGRFDGFAIPPALGSLNWTPPGRALPVGVPRIIMAIGGLAASIAAIVAVLGSPPPEPVMSQGPVVHRSVARASVALAVEMPPPPAPIPAAVTTEPAVTDVAKAAPPPLRPHAAVLEAPAFTMNTRNLEVTSGPQGQPVLNLRELPGSRAIDTRSGPAPLHRPAAVRQAEAASAMPTGEPADTIRPRARQYAEARPEPVAAPQSVAGPVADIVKRVAAADTEDFARPEHRPNAAPSVRVASLTPSDAMTVAALAATVFAPRARPDGFGDTAPAGPSPKPSVTPAADMAPPARRVASIPAPKLQRAVAATRPVAALAATPVRAPIVAAPARTPIVTAALTPQPKIVPIPPQPKAVRPAAPVKVVPVAAVPASAAPKATTARTAARAGLLRTQLSLIGVFGDTDKPHALVRLPSGDIQRVRSGDSVAGVQVASVSSDGVRVRSGGSETMLRLPD
ncbi:hypothetical protein HNP73_002333 [Amaricoccus macauensis]|uniref:Type IV pilus biogenesis protein PilP n=1 Tax=Amaricoccus macauensis TaxID=57001 RepID=A0A840SKD0_9RHOB|nr:hypothetical protein [Amaricoccus macauensis]MBB5222397.1 hypothetical protein [Amaricoccus macauensis]